MATKPEADSGDASLDEFAEAAQQAMTGRKTIGQVVYDLLRDAIVAGKLAPGERLRQEALAEAMGVSRIPVRTALMQLESDGLVEFHPRRGAAVSSLTVAQIQEIYEIREVLEVHALRRSLSEMTDSRVQRLRDYAEELDRQAEGPEFTELRIEFYRELYDAVRNPQLVKLIEDLRQGVGRYLLNRRIAHGVAHGHGTHSELIDYVSRRDVDSAVEWLRTHLRTVRAGVEKILQEPAPTRRPAIGRLTEVTDRG